MAQARQASAGNSPCPKARAPPRRNPRDVVALPRGIVLPGRRALLLACPPPHAARGAAGCAWRKGLSLVGSDWKIEAWLTALGLSHLDRGLEAALQTGVGLPRALTVADLVRGGLAAELPPASDPCVGKQTGVGIGRACYSSLWYQAGCSADVPDYSDWHQQQTYADLLQDARKYAALMDEEHVRGCQSTKQCASDSTRGTPLCVQLASGDPKSAVRAWTKTVAPPDADKLRAGLASLETWVTASADASELDVVYNGVRTAADCWRKCEDYLQCAGVVYSPHGDGCALAPPALLRR